MATHALVPAVSLLIQKQLGFHESQKTALQGDQAVTEHGKVLKRTVLTS